MSAGTAREHLRVAQRLGELPLIAERNAELEIAAETNECLWDGDRVHYGDVIDALVRVDRLS